VNRVASLTAELLHHFVHPEAEGHKILEGDTLSRRIDTVGLAVVLSFLLFVDSGRVLARLAPRSRVLVALDHELVQFAGVEEPVLVGVSCGESSRKLSQSFTGLFGY